MSSAPAQSPADLLYGVHSIAAHLSLTNAQVYHLHAKAALPTFKVGGKVCARRSALARHFASGEVAVPASPHEAHALSDENALLYGYRAIAAHLGIAAAEAAQRDRERLIPTYLDDGCICASTAVLDHYMSTKGER